jgi:hypothetical protein
MTKIVVDAALWGKLNNLEGPVELCDDSGRTLGYFHSVANPSEVERLPASLISDEELRRRRQEGGGRSLEAILADLEKR